MDAIKAIDEIDLDSAGLVALFDALMERVNRDLGRHGGHFTPSSVVKNAVAGLLNPRARTVCTTHHVGLANCSWRRRNAARDPYLAKR